MVYKIKKTGKEYTNLRDALTAGWESKRKIKIYAIDKKSCTILSANQAIMIINR